ncbi:MAG: hypothetical protein JO227_06485 [Acetobacteraceae bacterium]|nr:hypothetical protein [Acetobacteraceae bacterium]
MRTISQWLDDNGYWPTRYKYDHNEDAVLVIIDFDVDVAAEAFATRFADSYYSSPQPTSPDGGRRFIT